MTVVFVNGNPETGGIWGLLLAELERSDVVIASPPGFGAPVPDEWVDGAVGPEVGARFVGHNRQGIVRWSRTCEVTACDPGRDFAFRTFFKGAESTRWRYQLEPTPTGTLVTESFEVVSMPRWVQLMHRVPGMHAKSRRDARSNMATTLECLRIAAERRTDT